MQLGARRGYAVPRALQRAGLLGVLHTDLHAGHPAARLLSRGLPRPLRPGGLERLAARDTQGIPARRLRSAPAFALRRWWARSRGAGQEGRYDRWIAANTAYGALVARRGFAGADAVYGFNGAALEVFEEARRRGLATILDQTSAAVEVEEGLLAEERRRWAGWEEVPRCDEGARRMAAREREEWALADRIVCGSDWVRETLGIVGGPVERCVVVPYGLGSVRRGASRSSTHAGPLRVLFAGTSCLRKGSPYLWEAARAFSEDRVRFRIVGHVGLTDAARRRLEEVAVVEDAVPRSRMDRIYADADLLVLPSISEGSAGVTYEALGHGLPVVTTPNAGSVVRDGREGFLVAIRSSASLSAAIGRLAEDRGLLDAMGENALRRAGEHDLDAYARRLVAALGSLARRAGTPGPDADAETRTDPHRSSR